VLPSHWVDDELNGSIPKSAEGASSPYGLLADHVSGLFYFAFYPSKLGHLI
jgi:hypothetical protein